MVEQRIRNAKVVGSTPISGTIFSIASLSMGVLAFNHLNIRAPKPVLEDVKNFYVEFIGLSEGFRPDVPIHGYWLYLDGLPVLHLIASVVAEYLHRASMLPASNVIHGVKSSSSHYHRRGAN